MYLLVMQASHLFTCLEVENKICLPVCSIFNEYVLLAVMTLDLSMKCTLLLGAFLINCPYILIIDLCAVLVIRSSSCY